MPDLAHAREHMVRTQIAARGVRDPAVLEAMRSVPREAFLPPELEEFAYTDYAAADRARADDLAAVHRGLDGGGGSSSVPATACSRSAPGSGYAAAVLGRIAREVYTVERHEELASLAARPAGRRSDSRTSRCGTATARSAGPSTPRTTRSSWRRAARGCPSALLDQLAPGGRLVMPVGEGRGLQQLLVRVTRESDGSLRERRARRRALRAADRGAGLGGRAAEWDGRPPQPLSRPRHARPPHPRGRRAVAEIASMPTISARCSSASATSRLVLIGEATHGTSEFYRMRARITQELIRTRGFRIVAVEADWPDARRGQPLRPGASAIGYRPRGAARSRAFRPGCGATTRRWGFVEWLRVFNAEVREPAEQAGFYGLDLYSLFTSIRSGPRVPRARGSAGRARSRASDTPA